MVEHADELAIKVASARSKLSSVVEALTTVLLAVAESKPDANGQQQAEGNRSHSLSEVLIRVEQLRVAVDEATGAGENRRRIAAAQEEAVASAERETLMRRRDALMQKIAQKNVKVKILIDDLRELHRNIAVLFTRSW